MTTLSRLSRIGIKETIADYGVSEEDFLSTLDEMTEQAFDDQCTGANPRYPLIDEIKQMYLNAYYGRKFVEEKKPSQVTAPTKSVKRGRPAGKTAAKKNRK